MAEIKDDSVASFAPVAPSKAWQRFFCKFQEIEVLRNSKWKEVHILAYIAKRFKEVYNRKFCFSFNKSPSRCTETVLVKRIYLMLNTSNPRTIREYIDWVYDYKIIPKQVKIRKISFFLQLGLANEFYLYRDNKNKISKATQLPLEYQSIVSKLGLPVYTYGDLAFAKQALEQASEADSYMSYQEMFNELYSIGFEANVLQELI